MQKLQLLSITFLLFLFGCHDSVNYAIINGKIAGEIPEKIEYSVPIDGAAYVGFRKPLELDSLGNFSIKLPLKQASFVYFLVGRGLTKRLIVEPGESYELSFTRRGDEKDFLYKGKNKKGPELYNNLPRMGFIQGDAQHWV